MECSGACGAELQGSIWSRDSSPMLVRVPLIQEERPLRFRWFDVNLGAFGLSNWGSIWCVASGATGGACFEAWQFSKAAAIVASTSSVVYSQPSIGYLMAGMVLRPGRSRCMLAHLYTLPLSSLTQTVMCVGENGELTVQNAKQHMQGNSVSTCELHNDIMRYGLSKMPVNPSWIGLDGVGSASWVVSHQSIACTIQWLYPSKSMHCTHYNSPTAPFTRQRCTMSL